MINNYNSRINILFGAIGSSDSSAALLQNISKRIKAMMVNKNSCKYRHMLPEEAIMELGYTIFISSMN
jgi:hypothetical protein